MSLLTRVQSWLRTPAPYFGHRLDVRGIGAPFVVEGWRTGQVAWPEWDASAAHNYYYNLAVVYRCVTVLGDAVAEAPLRAYREDDEGNRQELPKRPVRRLLQRPNPRMSEAEFMVFVVQLASLSGYCVIEKVRSQAGRVVQLWALRLDWIAPKYQDGLPPDWVYKVPGREPRTLSYRDVIVFTYRDDPQFRATGVAPMRSVLRESATDHSMTDFAKQLFDSGAVPPAYLKYSGDSTSKKLIQEHLDTVRDMWAERTAGKDSWLRPPAVANFDLVPVGFSPNDLAYPELRDVTAERICSAFGIDKRLVGLGDDATYQNMREQRASLQEYTASPLRKRLDDVFTRGLLPEFEDDPSITLAFDTSTIAALQEDTDAVWKRYVEGWRAGVLTLDQVMSGVGEPEVGGKLGSARILPGNTSLIDAEGQVIASSLATAFSAGVNDDATATNGARASTRYVGEVPAGAFTPDAIAAMPTAHEDSRAWMHNNRGETFPTLARYVGALDRHEMHRLPAETRAAAVSTARDAMTRVADTHEPKLRAFFKAQGERIVGNMTRSDHAARFERAWTLAVENRHAAPTQAREVPRDAALAFFGCVDARGASQRATPKPTMDRRAAEFVNWDDETEHLRVVLQDLYNDAGESAYAEVVKLLTDLTGTEPGISFDISNPRIKDVADELGRRIVGISEQTRLDVAEVVTKALSEGKSLQELADNLTGLFEQTYRNRGMVVARSESQVSFNLANRLAYEDSGQVAAAELFDNPNHTESYRASDGLTCAQRNGLIVPLSEVDRHVYAEHPNGSLGVGPVLAQSLGGVQ